MDSQTRQMTSKYAWKKNFLKKKKFKSVKKYTSEYVVDKFNEFRANTQFIFSFCYSHNDEIVDVLMND